MKILAAIVAACIVAALGIFLLSKHSSDGKPPVSAQTPSDVPTLGHSPKLNSELPQDAGRRDAPVAEGRSLTTEQFERLPPQEQNKAIESFVAAFWKRESAGLQAADPQERQYLSLDIFNRPYMRSVTENELSQLSPQDQETVMAETLDSCRQSLNYVFEVVAQVQIGRDNHDPARTEAYLISALETGRGLSAKKDGIVISRLTSISCQAIVLKEMVSLYTSTGDSAKLEAAQQQLRDLRAEMNEIRAAARQADGS